MSKDEIANYVSIDFVPRDTICEWCGRLAEEQLTAVGGAHHNEGGFFCRECGKEFIHMVKGERPEVDPETLVGLD